MGGRSGLKRSRLGRGETRLPRSLSHLTLPIWLSIDSFIPKTLKTFTLSLLASLSLTHRTGVSFPDIHIGICILHLCLFVGHRVTSPVWWELPRRADRAHRRFVLLLLPLDQSCTINTHPHQPPTALPFFLLPLCPTLSTTCVTCPLRPSRCSPSSARG